MLSPFFELGFNKVAAVFPLPERDREQHIKSVTRNGGRGISVKVSNEANKYHEGETYDSILGKLKITKVIKYYDFNSILNNPDINNELTKTQLDILKKYSDFAVVYFKLL